MLKIHLLRIVIQYSVIRAGIYISKKPPVSSRCTSKVGNLAEPGCWQWWWCGDLGGILAQREVVRACPRERSKVSGLERSGRDLFKR